MSTKELLELFKRMPVAKKPIGGLEPIPAHKNPCEDSEHFPPNYICIPYGMQYRHKCPSCGHESIIQSSEVRFSA